jgi:PLP dependent protein
MTMIEQNIQKVHTRIRRACASAGRDVQSVRLLAVSKTFDAEAVLEAAAAGQLAFGENYVQEAVHKINTINEIQKSNVLHSFPSLEWHCIGPLQANKTRVVAEHFDWVQSIDRLKIAQRLSEQRPAHLPPLQVCIQVNVDGGANKSGITPAELPALAHAVAALPRLRLRGLMCIPEPAINFIASTALFKSVIDLFDSLNEQGFDLDTLSMGMSDDLEAAIAGGSTMIRIGRAVFGDRALKSVVM